MPNGQSIFDDLPDAETPKKPEGETPEHQEKDVEARRNLEKANKREDAKLAKLNEDLAAKRKKAKELKAKLEKPDEEEDEGGDEELEDKEESQPVQEAVNKALKDRDEKSRRDQLALEIRKVAKNRQEAEEMFDMALTLPPTTPELDARFAAERVQTLRENRRGFVSPSFSGGGGFSEMGSRTDEIEGFSDERIEFLQGMGVSKDEIKKYKDGLDLARIYPKVGVNRK